MLMHDCFVYLQCSRQEIFCSGIAHFHTHSLLFLFSFLMTHVQWACALRKVPPAVVMDWLSQSSFSISDLKVKARKRWIGIEIGEVQMDNGLTMRGIDAHITLVRFDKDDEAGKLVDLRNAEEFASDLLCQALLQFENEISLHSNSSGLSASYECRSLQEKCFFLPAFWFLRRRILTELDIEDATLPRYPHLSISGMQNMQITMNPDQYERFDIERYCSSRVTCNASV